MSETKRNQYLRMAPEVAQAVAEGKPVVALESTIISHGMPYPRNLTTARTVESDVRAAGAIPATVAIMDGAFQVGLSEAQLEQLATASGVMKVSRRDLGVAFASGSPGATTVATTMLGAHWAGISFFATGGTGGVHRGVEATMDISADLYELAQTPVAVVSAGVKSILDIPRTLECLESLGVPVFGFGTREFPAFYTRTTGLFVPHSVDSPEALAAALDAQWSSGLQMGALVANPIPETDELEHGYIEQVIEQAVLDADQQKIHGKDLTPFLLGRIVELTGGKSLEANIALVRNNARVAAQAAVALVALRS